MQIAGGIWKGKILDYPKKGLRPTTDKIRSAVFNMIEANFPDLLQCAKVCDIFCGAGAVGIEALSRGAQNATFIDKDRLTIRCLQNNVKEIEARTTIIPFDAIKALERIKSEKFDLIFLDPPYNMDLVEPVIKRIGEYHILNQKGIIVIEHHKKEKFAIPENLIMYKEKKYSDTVVTILINKEHK